jgi:hypothetical protein
MLCCPVQVEVSETDWSLVQRSPTVCLNTLMQKERGNHCIKKILTDIPSISSSWELLQTNLNYWKQWERMRIVVVVTVQVSSELSAGISVPNSWPLALAKFSNLAYWAALLGRFQFIILIYQNKPSVQPLCMHSSCIRTEVLLWNNIFCLSRDLKMENIMLDATQEHTKLLGKLWNVSFKSDLWYLLIV